MNWNRLRIKVKQKGMTSVKEAHKVSYYVCIAVTLLFSESCQNFADSSNSGLEI